jgi:hypothetical protein
MVCTCKRACVVSPCRSQILKWVTAPISWPLARILDWLLGHHTVLTYKRRELKVCTGHVVVICWADDLGTEPFHASVPWLSGWPMQYDAVRPAADSI